MTNWETIEVPRGAFISWGSTPGQHVTGKVLSYEPEGGTNFAGDPCPSLSIELTEPSESINKEGVRSTFAVGETIVLNAGQVSLKRGVRAAGITAGDHVKITFMSVAKTSSGGTVKEFSIQISRDSHGPTVPAGDAPPF